MNSKLKIDKSALVVTALDEAGGEKTIGFPGLRTNGFRPWKRSVSSIMATIKLPPDFKEFLKLLSEHSIAAKPGEFIPADLATGQPAPDKMHGSLRSAPRFSKRRAPEQA